ncbi:protein phosphatase 2C domain-containing protein [Ditylenchus destructor]|nr:protein phosphatase 2C domain-containing protein [Ditylenchus destructor]
MKLSKWQQIRQVKGIATSARNKLVADSLLRANEISLALNDGAISRVDISQLGANQPVEDFYSGSKCLSSDAYFFGVFDGHAGAACSRHVSTRLYDYLCAAVLSKHEINKIKNLAERLQWVILLTTPLFYFKRFSQNPDVGTVRKALQTAFSSLDEDLANGAMPDSHGQVCRMSVNVAASGSCALVSHLRECHLHVANCGDSEAVLGVSNLNTGISARLLSRPHTVDNADEISRVRMSHPASESATILKGGRLLGELYPLRAFGDLRYKWSLELQRVVLEPLGVPAPRNLHTPPYLTAQPEVLYHRLTPNDKFLVLASDGLWDFLDPDTVVRLIEDHTLGTQTLSDYQPPVGHTLGDVLKDLENRKKGEARTKLLDENSATHVIRNALGGCSGGPELQYARLYESLQLPPGTARHFRDDITVIVIHFNEHFLIEQHLANETSVTNM